MDRAKAGNRLRIFGEVRVGARGLELYHPEIQADYRTHTST